MKYGRLMKMITLALWLSGMSTNARAQQQWVSFSGTIPANAVVGGFENGQPLYVGRMPFQGGVHPGKILPGGICNIGWGGKEYSVNSGFDVLTAPPNTVEWVEYRGSVPANAILGGYNDAAGREPLYVAKHAYQGGEHCGKLWAGACNIGWGGSEVVLKEKIFVLASVTPKNGLAGSKLKTSVATDDGSGYSSKSQQGTYTSWADKWQLPSAGKAAILFKATAKNDIHIAFADAANTMDPMYEIVIGGWNNTKCAIRRRSQGPAIKESAGAIRKPGLADDYWAMVDKDKGVIAAGFGNVVGQNVIVETKDANFLANVRYFALSSWDTPIEYADVRAAALAEEKPSGVYVRALKPVYKKDEKIVVEYNDFPTEWSPWINIVRKGTRDDEWGDYQYTKGKSGKLEFEFTWGLEPGDYEVRGYFNSSDYTVKARYAFKVVE